MPVRSDEGFGNAELSIPHPPSATILTLPKGEVNILWCKILRLRLSASRRMTRVVFSDDSDDYKKGLSKMMYI